jgi:hypothetical protein
LVLVSIGSGRRGAAVHAQTSVDGGESWTDAVAAESLPSHHNAYEPALLVNPDGTILGVWGRSPIPSATARAVSVAQRGASGAWRILDYFELPSEIWGMWVRPAPGGFHAIMRSMDSTGFNYMRWSAGGWAVTAIPGADDGIPNPAWVAIAPDVVQLYWSYILDHRFLPATKVRRFAVCRF